MEGLPMTPVFLCRFGELFLKLGNRSRFERALERNIRRMLAGVPGVRVESPHGRVLAFCDEATRAEVAARLGRVFGLVSFSPALAVDRDLEALRAAAVRLAEEALLREPFRRRSFKVEARRSDKSFPLTSIELGARIGDAVAAATKIPVDVHEPALRVGVEVGRERAYVFTDSLPAPGGLPLGTAGRALLLLSGGIDSPVAGWLAAKRGLALDAIYFHSPPFVGEKSKDKVISLARELGRWNALRRVHVVHFTEIQRQLREAGPAELAVVLYRRTMLRVADRLADVIGAEALVTGENLGQVASQTLQNMSVIDAAARRLVLRPLVTHDKQETIAIARRIGTFDTSALPFDDCCSLFVPAHPATAARLDTVLRAEEKLDLAAAVEAMVERSEGITVDETGQGDATRLTEPTEPSSASGASETP
jgi:thiamine biosynthesis protein ThiI